MLYVWVFLLQYMPVHYVHTCCPWRSEEDIGSSGTPVIGDCEPSWGWWESNPSPLQEGSVLLTKPSLQPLSWETFLSVASLKCQLLESWGKRTPSSRSACAEKVFKTSLSTLVKCHLKTKRGEHTTFGQVLDATFSWRSIYHSLRCIILSSENLSAPMHKPILKLNKQEKKKQGRS